MPDSETLKRLPIPLDRDVFFRMLIRELAGTLEEVVGYEEAAGYISLVGQSMGDWINNLYKKELNVVQFTPDQLAAVLVDLKQRIHGNFSVQALEKDRIYLTSTTCPFGDKVLDRNSMCMMTSNVFGVIAADSLGYAKVELCKTIARHQGECRVCIYTRQTPESDAVQGREYFKL